ncbi:glycoside hydrolase family 31 protein [Butyrivibrio sp. YAB3001]|uniref:glycoside hydrolase family 31 protein n=1 Tax=Butyrivibrio sp. YAB3001 TaxID=1520812 RepID=UPI0008F629C4|nr:TIM-barrel domain-containing protein [Butyrivibrio sp. YAB3001]SFB83188.1 alpha-D-xyloside xylohydrolase [Butyrivibrio sp. YAB3001]
MDTDKMNKILAKQNELGERWEYDGEGTNKARLTRFSFGDNKKSSIVVCEDGISKTVSKDEIGSGYSIENDGKVLLTVYEPEFEDYEITRSTSKETITRKTVDGIKVSLSEGKKKFIRNSKHAVITLKISDGLLFGLGSHEEGYRCLNGIDLPLYQENLKISIPFFVSTAGFACLVDNNSYMRFDNTETSVVKIYVDCADHLDMYLFAGELDEIHKAYRSLTGITPMMPKWALGYAQSKERYENAKELLDVVQKYRDLQVPLDLIVQDWQYWEGGLWGQKSFDKSRYADIDKVIDKIHALGAHVMISIWPNMDGNGPDQKEFLEKGLMLGDGSVYDVFNADARDVYWQQAYEGLFKYGIDAWWCDSSEPYDANWEGEVRPDKELRTKKAVNEYKKYVDDADVNVYSLYHSMGIYEHQRQASGKRVLNLTRSGYAGQHRYATVTWSGDISASWETLEKQVYILQNYTICGEAYWNSDIGAFFVKRGSQWFWNGEYDRGCEDDAYKELYVRWLQFAGFTTLMRSHGTDTPREIWNFGEPGTVYFDAIKKAIELRYTLLPFFYSMAAKVTFEGIMPVKPLAFSFPEDKGALEAFDEYMYGNEVLVCPITAKGVTEKDIYLPKGLWYDLYTKKSYEGGRNIKISVDLEHIPVFIKAGAILPTVEVMQYTDERKDAPYKVLAFSGADGSFDLYDDAGDGYDYESGEYSLIHIEYDDKKHSIKQEQLGKDKYAHEVVFEIIK